jgi:hypothetical protein
MKTKFITSTVTIIICLLFSRTVLVSQEIEATVTLNTEGMPTEQLQNIEFFKPTLERYLNTQRFTNIDWEGPRIPVSVSIQLTSMGRNNYAANLFIAAKRTIDESENRSSTSMMFEDVGNWAFEYTDGLSLSYDFTRYDNIASILDFYMLVIIGLDLDSYGELDGDQVFQRARQVFDVAVNRGANGWQSFGTDYGKHTLLQDLTNARLDPFRKLIFEYYVDGLDLLDEDRPQALANIAGTIGRMADFKERFLNLSHLMDLFFFAKCQELCELFRGNTDHPKIFRDLIYLDPTNTVRYEAARDGRRR